MNDLEEFIKLLLEAECIEEVTETLNLMVVDGEYDEDAPTWRFLINVNKQLKEEYERRSET